jgi:hypothetical protein
MKTIVKSQDTRYALLRDRMSQVRLPLPNALKGLHRVRAIRNLTRKQLRSVFLAPHYLHHVEVYYTQSTLESLTFQATIDNGKLFVGCQQFGRYSTAKLRKWALGR